MKLERDIADLDLEKKLLPNSKGKEGGGGGGNCCNYQKKYKNSKKLKNK